MEEKRLVGRKNWSTYKWEVLLQIGAKAMSRYITGTIQRPIIIPPPSPKFVATGIEPATQTPTPKPEPPPEPPAPIQYFSANPLLEEWVARD